MKELLMCIIGLYAELCVHDFMKVMCKELLFADVVWMYVCVCSCFA
jgi:hypothetical protein